MKKRLSSNTTRLKFNFLWVMLLAASCVAVGQCVQHACLAQQAASVAVSDHVQSFVFIIHVDAMPPYTAAATELLKNYRKDSLHDSGVKRVELLQQVGHTNHFTIVEEWENQEAYDAHISAAHTREFRSTLQPMLGAPFDERSHHSLD